ncbi:MAG: hypothetical protein ACE5DL_02775 [Nitrosopumilaceae archaeon]
MKPDHFKKRIKISLIPVVFSLFLFSMGIIEERQVFAISDLDKSKKEYIDFQKYTGNRLLVFNDTRVDYCITNNEQNPEFNDIAVNAVNTWHDKIVEVTQNSEVWDMTTHVFPKDESICDGYVNYYDTPNPMFFQLSGVAGFSHPQTPVANVTIYTDNYQSTLLKMAEDDENFWDTMTIEKFQDIIKNQKHEPFDLDTIKRITLHEIGHSLSLNHPITDGKPLQETSGIMGYNMSYTQIDSDEVANIVKAYPNGFTKVTKEDSLKLDGHNKKKMLTLGEVVNLTIELPENEGKLPPSGVEVYIFPEGTSSLKTEKAPVKIIRIVGQKQIVNNGDYLEDINSIMTHWGSSSKVLSIQFKVIKEFDSADMIVVTHNVGGFEEQWFLDDVLSVKKAMFSNLLLDFETTEYKYYLMGSNPNREIERESAFKIKQEQLFTDALSQCLIQKNMKKCSDEIKIEDFKQEPKPVIWMP